MSQTVESLSSEAGKTGLQRSIQLLIEQYADEYILSINDTKAVSELEKIRKYIMDEKNIDALADDIQSVFSRIGLSSVKDGTIARYLDELAYTVKQNCQEFKITENSICRYDCSKRPDKRLIFITSPPETNNSDIEFGSQPQASRVEFHSQSQTSKMSEVELGSQQQSSKTISVEMEDEFEPGASRSNKICISTDKSLCHIYIIGSFIGFTKYDYKIFAQNHIDRVILFIENNGSFVRGESGHPEHFNWRYYRQNTEFSITPLIVVVAAILLIYIGRKAKILE